MLALLVGDLSQVNDQPSWGGLQREIERIKRVRKREDQKKKTLSPATDTAHMNAT